VHLLDLSLPTTDGASSGEDVRPWAAAAGDPWRPVELMAGDHASRLSRRAVMREPAGVGVTLTALPKGAPDRLLRGARLTVRIEGGRLQSRAWSEVARGGNALAVQHAGGEWELLQFLDAELIGPETYQLRGLLRAQAGTDAAISGELAPGAPVVVVDQALVRVEVSEVERGGALLWRAVPAGADRVSTTEAGYTWRGLQSRPWSPARLRARRTPDGGVAIRWTRRDRTNGESWDGEPPTSEVREVYQVEVFAAERPVRRWEIGTAGLAYGPNEIAADFPAGAPAFLDVIVRQGSASFGWGAPARRRLWL
jgi:hypothetical protein